MSSEIDLKQFTTQLIQHRRSFLVALAVSVLLGIAYLHWATREYQVTLNVTPTSTNASALPSGLSSLASLAGIGGLSGAEGPPFELYVASVSSRRAADRLSANVDLMSAVFIDEWDSKARTWQEPGGLVYRALSTVKWILGNKEQWSAPNGGQLHEFLESVVSVSSDRDSPITRISMIHENPELAAQLLSALHITVDEFLREREIKRTNEYVDYLRKQLEGAVVMEYRQALSQIISEQEKLRMMASANLPFAADPLSEPVINPDPVSPNDFASLFLFVIIGQLLVLLRVLFRQN